MNLSTAIDNIPTLFTFAVALAGLLYLLAEEALISGEQQTFEDMFKAKLRPGNNHDDDR